MDHRLQFANKVIVITGASSGIGEATAHLFAERGAMVYNLDLVKSSDLNLNIHWCYCDVANSSNIHEAFTYIISHQQKIDYLFANAGIYAESPLISVTEAAINNIIDVNLKGVIYILRAVLPVMQRQKSGSVVLMGSEQSFIGRKNNAVYAATKGAIAQLTKGLALEYAVDNIRVNAVCPGAILTPLTQRAIELESKLKQVPAENIYNDIVNTIPLGRFGTPKDVAEAVAYLCSDQSSFVTGNLLCIDGGVVAG